ncbi:MAG: metallophosphoesterase [Candidatus Aquicultor sp.]|nr:metallophosphoesterase [Candidatus Aquicultor sp.]
MGDKAPITIAHISDLHIGSQYFIPNLLSRTIEELNELKPDAVICTGDFTDAGFRQEYTTAQMFLSTIECERRLFIPGNHDSRNVGYVHFEELFGERDRVLTFDRMMIVGTDSSEPDLDNGRIGRERYAWLKDAFEDDNYFKVLALHHHLLPIPGTGRERSMVYDAGDLLEVLIDCGIDLVLCGHKHVPYVWRLESLVVVNAGTASSLRLRGKTKPCYNIIEIDERDNIKIYRKYPYGGRELIAEFSCDDRNYCKWERVEVDVVSGGGRP